VGFAGPVDPQAWNATLAGGRRDQQRLLELLGAEAADELQATLKPWLARRAAVPEELEGVLRPRLANGEDWSDVKARLTTLHGVYWAVLDALNPIPVKAGDVIYNANPPRVTEADDRPASAEVHALGNPEGRSVFALEIRRPGTTFRAWDNVRFPLRDIDIDATLEALSLTATRPEEFLVGSTPVRAGVRRSVDSEHFRLEHLEPAPHLVVEVAASEPHTLHALAGRASIVRSTGKEIGTLERGESALVPAQVGAYRVVAADGPAALVKVTLPPYAD
jgi:hypothetical protein